jgi:hypothetical protein
MTIEDRLTAAVQALQSADGILVGADLRAIARTAVTSAFPELVERPPEGLVPQIAWVRPFADDSSSHPPRS